MHRTIEERQVARSRKTGCAALLQSPLPDSNRSNLQDESPFCGAFVRALFRTRTGDPLLTMEVLYQLS